MKYRQYIEDHTLRLEATRRGGGIEIDVDPLFADDDVFGYPLRISAYQNYLGGGLLGSIQNSLNFDSSELLASADQKRLLEVCDDLRQYFHDVTNEMAGEYDEWAEADYESVQTRPESAY